ncbi:GNAT family N-acetyltransferase [Vogesella indigofera]|uniref:GNAT family N-acetyltransferase n=1 Tax=Vogesella indigofera TaxID=45465 RepID=UPI00234F7581|nr:GNAT family N-acetyltransferase [Vogesella indigofera]MDC7702596.1 GNAT family N-acetyltransferase [Vogesella indigofera]
MIIREWLAGETADPAQLAGLLLSCVQDGASIGFLSSLHHTEAEDYWQALAANLGVELRCWLAISEGRIIGSVQLASCGKANGRHRAEIQKLMVHPDARGQGVAAKLMQQAEAAARADGRLLLVLDTDAGSLAARLYPRWGWQHAGDIPGYAASPDGHLHATRYFYKQLTS